MEFIIHIIVLVLYFVGLVIAFSIGWILGHRKGYKQATTDYRRYLGEDVGKQAVAKREVETSGEGATVPQN
jgi:hypothetical protein